jgi:hypothetical protein
MRSSRRLAGTLPAASQMHAAPDPRARTGWSGASPHVLRFPLRAFLRFPVCPPGSPPSPAVPGFPSSGVLRFGPFGRCPVPVLRRFPSGFPSLSNLHVSGLWGNLWGAVTLALPRAGSAGAGPGRQGPRSPVLPRPPRLDHAIRPHCRWAAAGQDGIPPQNRLLPAAASAGHRRARTAQGGSRT